MKNGKVTPNMILSEIEKLSISIDSDLVELKELLQ